MALSKFNIFESHINSRKNVRTILHSYNLLNPKAHINEDLSVDYDGNVDLSHGDLKEKSINFNIVYGNFTCFGNKLSNLKNFPKYVYGNFNCGHNKIKSLKDCPLVINGYIICYNNQITNISVDHYTKIHRGQIDGLKDNPIKELLKYLVRRTNQLELDLVERLEEFEVIKNEIEIDMISLNQLFDFYNVSFLNVNRHLMETKGVMENYILK